MPSDITEALRKLLRAGEPSPAPSEYFKPSAREIIRKFLEKAPKTQGEWDSFIRIAAPGRPAPSLGRTPQFYPSPPPSSTFKVAERPLDIISRTLKQGIRSLPGKAIQVGQKSLKSLPFAARALASPIFYLPEGEMERLQIQTEDSLRPLASKLDDLIDDLRSGRITSEQRQEYLRKLQDPDLNLPSQVVPEFISPGMTGMPGAVVSGFGAGVVNLPAGAGRQRGVATSSPDRVPAANILSAIASSPADAIAKFAAGLSQSFGNLRKPIKTEKSPPPAGGSGGVFNEKPIPSIQEMVMNLQKGLKSLEPSYPESRTPDLLKRLEAADVQERLRLNRLAEESKPLSPYEQGQKFLSEYSANLMGRGGETIPPVGELMRSSAIPQLEASAKADTARSLERMNYRNFLVDLAKADMERQLQAESKRFLAKMDKESRTEAARLAKEGKIEAAQILAQQKTEEAEERREAQRQLLLSDLAEKIQKRKDAFISKYLMDINRNSKTKNLPQEEKYRLAEAAAEDYFDRQYGSMLKPLLY